MNKGLVDELRIDKGNAIVSERTYSANGIKNTSSNISGSVRDDDILSIINQVITKNKIQFNGDLIAVNVVKSSPGDDAFMFLERQYQRGSGIYLKNLGQTLTFVNRTYRDIKFNGYAEFKSALKAIENGELLTFKQEYAVECVWHEMRHAQAKGWGNIVNSDARSNPQARLLKLVSESINQFCSRRSYDDFLTAIGGSASNKEWILVNGYGYTRGVANLGAMIDFFKIDRTVAYKNLDYIFKNSYNEDIIGKVADFISKEAGISKRNVVEILKYLEESDFTFKRNLKPTK